MTSNARRILVGVAAAAAMAAPSAQASTPAGYMSAPKQDLRNPDQQAPAPKATPSSSAAPGLKHGGDLRYELGTSSLAGTTSPPPAPAVHPQPASGGFDWLSATIGAIAAAGLALASWTALGMRRTARA